MRNKNEFILGWGGDVSLARRQHLLLDAFLQSGQAETAQLALPALSTADLTLVNLECVLSDLGEQGHDKGEGGPYYFRARPQMTEVLTRLGIDMVATANNHSGDYGPEALLDQARWLDLAGIAHVGSGRDRESAFAPRFLTRNGVKLAVFALDATQDTFAASADTPGNAYLSLQEPAAWQQEMQPRFAAARELADVIVVCVHWGPNLKAEPGPRQRAAGQALVRAGADVILGSSAHVLQGIEVFDGRPIIHDAGNLLCDFADAGNDGAVFRLTCGPAGVTAIEVVPVMVLPGAAYEAKAEAAAEIAARYSAKSAALGTDLRPSADHRLHLRLEPPERPARQPYRDQLRARFAATPIPEACRIAPVEIGPLTLHGLHFGPQVLHSRGMVWVETWWSSAAPVPQRLQIALHGVPRRKGKMPIWGAGMAHEPCDWRLPTPQWQPGEIYHERFGLRPPPRARLENDSLDLEVSVIEAGRRLGRWRSELSVRLDFAALPPGLAQLSPAPPAANAVAAQAAAASPASGWSAQQLAAITGGSWIRPPPPAWRCGAVVAGTSHISMVPGPVLFAAHSQQDRNRLENFVTPSARNWDSHARLARHAPLLAGALVRCVPEGLSAEFPLLQVEDPLGATMQIGEAARARMRGQVVCVTGSSGKTTTTSMLQTALSPLCQLRATYDNYNTRVGLLVNLASAQPDTDVFILETALSAINSTRQNHIRRVNPDIALITNITTAHLRKGETTLDIARKKSNIFLGMQRGKVALLWRESAHFDYMAGRARAAGLELVTFGQDAAADFRLLDYDAQSQMVRAGVPGGEIRYRIGASGSHMALNSLAALAVAGRLALDLAQVAQGFAAFSPLPGRGETLQLRCQGRRFWLQDEAYNANPLSMAAALRSFSAAHAGASERLIILGDMLELGDASPALHAGLIPEIIAAAPQRVLLVGTEMSALANGLRAQGIAVESHMEANGLAERLSDLIAADSAMLIKASNGVGLWKLVAHLRREGQ